MRVAQIVEAHPRQAGPLDERVEPAAEEVALEEGLAPAAHQASPASVNPLSARGVLA